MNCLFGLEHTVIETTFIPPPPHPYVLVCFLVKIKVAQIPL